MKPSKLPSAQTRTARARRRVVLPTYPFARERHWLEVDAVVPPETAVDSSALWNTLVAAGQRQSLQAPLQLRVQS